MFKKVKDKLILENNNEMYDFLNSVEDYKKIIILITNPKNEVTINLEIDEGMSEEELNICKNYREFIEEFLKKRQEYLNSDSSNTDDEMLF